MFTAPLPPLSATLVDPTMPLARFAQRFLGSAPTGIEEIGNGNLNHVYRVTSADGSIIVKQALPYVRRIGASWPLTIRRLGIEARAYDVHARVAGHLLPHMLGYDGDIHALALEDLRESTDWRTLLTNDDDVSTAAAVAGEYCGRIAAGTGTLLLDTAQAAELRNVFGDPAMQVFTERMAFTAPYQDDSTNAWPEHLKTVAARIRTDETVKAAVARARWLFRTSGECLLHGDLHSGSVMTGAHQRSHIIDLEFAFIGPIAFDLGNIVAHLLLARARRTVTGGDIAAVDAAATAFWASFSETLRSSASSASYWSPRFEQRLLVDCALFAAVEILRRVGGRFHVHDLQSLDADHRESAERLAINYWYRLLTSTGLREFEELWDLATNSEKDYL